MKAILALIMALTSFGLLGSAVNAVEAPTAATPTVELSVSAPKVANRLPAIAAGCRAVAAGRQISAHCEVLNNGYWVYARGVCKMIPKIGNAMYGVYSSRTYLSWTDVFVYCASGYYVVSWGFQTGR